MNELLKTLIIIISVCVAVNLLVSIIVIRGIFKDGK